MTVPLTSRLSLLSLLLLLAVVAGGRVFDRLVMTKHWSEAHPEASEAKARCLEPGKEWTWDRTHRGDVAFCYDEQTGRWVVIVLAIVGGALVLITGYTIKGGKTPSEWKNRPSNRGRI